jgi:hypothetical protein
MKKVTNKDIKNLHQCMHILNDLLAGKKLDGKEMKQDLLLEYKVSLSDINAAIENSDIKD